MLCTNKIKPVQVGVIATLFSLIGSILAFILAIALLNDEIAKQSSNKDSLKRQIQNLIEQS